MVGDIWQFFVTLMTYLLQYFYNTTGNYGIAIILLTALIKIVTYPLTHKQFKAMQDMQKLQPLMKEIQEKYKGKPQEMQKQIMNIYKTHKINPLSGCLPLIIQMPILILLYQTILTFKNKFVDEAFLLSNTSTLFTATGFLWIPTLLAPDMLLLLLYAVSMYISQKITIIPTPDPQQKQMQETMAIMMPVMFTIMFRTFPSAFILYWFAFNIFSTVHQFIVIRPQIKLAKEKEKESKENNEKKK